MLSVHLALNDRTAGSSTPTCSRLKPGAFFINTARAAVVDYEALAKAVQEKGFASGSTST